MVFPEYSYENYENLILKILIMMILSYLGYRRLLCANEQITAIRDVISIKFNRSPFKVYLITFTTSQQGSKPNVFVRRDGTCLRLKTPKKKFPSGDRESNTPLRLG